tara:strand:- start:786 stop:1838 length:1053 start_codon:yes stop_codon:yes gene_type:complete
MPVSRQTNKNYFQKIRPFNAGTTPDGIERGQFDLAFQEDFQTALGAPALSSFYIVNLDLAAGSSNASSDLEESLENWLASCGVMDTPAAMRRYSLLATEAILPGTSMSTLTEQGSRQGITERFATQRAYNDIAITYYIPSDYTSLRLFQEWINFMNPLYYKSGNAQEDSRLRHGYPDGYPKAQDSNSFHRFRYPNEYKKSLTITKFERNVGQSQSQLKNYSTAPKDEQSNDNPFVRTLDDNDRFAMNKKYGMFDPEAISYKFINAFPTSIQDVALTYQNSTVLQVTVEFAYDRYIIVTNQGEIGNDRSAPASSKSNEGTVISDGDNKANVFVQNSPLGTNNLANVNNNIA